MASLSSGSLSGFSIDFADVINNMPAPNSSGYFIEAMTSLNTYIQDEYSKGRITGNDYAQVLIAAMQYALQAAFEYNFRSKQLEFEWKKTQEELDLIKAQTRKTIAEAELAELQLEIGKATKADMIAKAKNENDAVLAQVNKIKEETKLITAKIQTETKQQAVLAEQVKVYAAQAISFKKRHESDLLKIYTNAAIGTAGGSTVLDYLKSTLGTQGSNIKAIADQAKPWS